MIILEHEAKALLRAQGLPIPDGRIAETQAEAISIVEKLAKPAVLKAQIPIGGRMKAGGIHFVETYDETSHFAQQLLDNPVRGFAVEQILVEEKLTIQSEIYLAISYDEAARRAVILGGLTGGIDIEDNAAVSRFELPLLNEFSDYMGRTIAAEMGLVGQAVVKLGNIINQLVRCFLSWDALLLECNPVILDSAGQWWIADVHLELDDDALFRQTALVVPHSQKIANQRSEFEQRALEIDHADHRGVAGRLIPFGGTLGLLIGGGGASLTAMDAILEAGLQPANYCEIGGNPSVWKIKELTKLILTQPHVQNLAVIMNVVSNTRVDLVARGVIKGILELGRTPSEVIVAFRIPGSWEDEGRLILEHYQIPMFDRHTTIDQVVQAIS